MTPEPKFPVDPPANLPELAVHLLELDSVAIEHKAAARRYLDVLRRIRLLTRRSEQARDRYRTAGLGEIPGFKAPLSVAGAGSLAIVYAEVLRNKGLPIAFELDENGRHQGTPIGQVMAHLHAMGMEGAEDVGRVMDLYLDYLGGWLSDAKQAKIPPLLARLGVLKSAMENRLMIAIVQRPTLADPRFAICIQTEILERATADNVGQSMLIGATHRKLAIDGLGVTGRVMGEGVVSVRTRDIRRILKLHRTWSAMPGWASMLGFQFNLDHWLVWAIPFGNSAADPVAPIHAMRFSYWRE